MSAHSPNNHQDSDRSNRPLRRPLPPAAAGSRGAHAPSVLIVVEDRFLVLSGRPAYQIDGFAVPGLADRWLPPAEVRDLLLAPTTSFATRDAAMNWLLERVRSDCGEWTIVLAGMLLPGLHRVLGGPCRRHPKLLTEIEAEAFTGLLAAAAAAKPGGQRVAATLTWPARRAADRYLRVELAQHDDDALQDWTENDTEQPVRPVSSYFAEHADFVFAAAVCEGVLAAEDAELIIQTRLEHQPLADVANRLHVSYAAASKRRQRAESQLEPWLRTRLTAEPSGPPAAAGFVPNASGVTGCPSGGRPRKGRRPDRRSGVRQPTTPPWR